eukprot:jgi/Ulvmu1/11964/UM082_0043.1
MCWAGVAAPVSALCGMCKLRACNVCAVGCVEERYTRHVRSLSSAPLIMRLCSRYLHVSLWHVGLQMRQQPQQSQLVPSPHRCAFMQCIHAVHSCSAFMRCIHAVHSYCAFMQ